jgi:hypothetical protein
VSIGRVFFSDFQYYFATVAYFLCLYLFPVFLSINKSNNDSMLFLWLFLSGTSIISPLGSGASTRVYLWATLSMWGSCNTKWSWSSPDWSWTNTEDTDDAVAMYCCITYCKYLFILFISSIIFTWAFATLSTILFPMALYPFANRMVDFIIWLHEKNKIEIKNYNT